MSLEDFRQTGEGFLQLIETDPLNFPRKTLALETLWWGAEEIIVSAFKNKRTAVKAGHSMSKDWAAGIIALEWLFRYYPSKVILTAPTQRQVVLIMFEEIKKQFNRLKSKVPFKFRGDELTTSMLRLGPDWFAVGFTTTEAGESIGKFMGFKSPHMLVIVSEAQRVHDNVYDQIHGIMSSGHAHILEIGNPIAPEGRFWQHCTQARHGYNVITLSCFDSPNVTAGREVIPGMVCREFIDDMRLAWGEDHPYWYSRILGEFPQGGSDAIIPIAWIMRAVNREIVSDDHIKVAGLDVALRGSDECVHLVLDGPRVTRIDGFHEMDAAKIVGWAKNLTKEENIDLYVCDHGGLADIESFLEESHIPVERFNFGHKVEGFDDYLNYGALAWWHLRLAFQNNQISIPDDEVLIGQLARRRFEYTSDRKYKIKLEAKKDARSRGEESPDRGDALAMAWWGRYLLLTGAGEMSDDNESEASQVDARIARRKSSGNKTFISEADDIRY